MGTPKKLPFASGQASGYDELGGASPAFINAIPEGDGFRVRPGLVRSSRLPSAGAFLSTAQVECMAAFRGRIIYVTSDRKVFMVDQTGHTTNLSVDGGASLVAGTVKPKIYASGLYCLIAGGGVLQGVTPGLESARLGGDVPPLAIDVAMNSQRILAITAGTDEYYYSGLIPVGVNVWDTDLNYVVAVARPDENVAISDNANEVWIWGKTTTQIMAPDSSYIYVPAVSTDVGCSARDSVVKAESRHAWLDDRNRIQLSNGRIIDDTTDISKPIKSTLETLTRTDDCWSFRARIANHDLLVWVFPTAGKTFCYDLAGVWGEIRGWRNGRWQPWYPTAYCWWPEMRMHVVGLPDGTLAEMTFDADTDLGEPVPWRVRTGFHDHGTSELKTVPELMVRTRPSALQAADIAVMWRDDLGSFCWPVAVQGYQPSDCNLKVEPVGEPYVTRQYELSGQADSTNYVASATENLVLEEP